MIHRYDRPIKMPRGSHYGSDYWIAKSYKLHRNVCLYSMLEYANYLELEMNPDVEYFCEQPFSVELLVGSIENKIPALIRKCLTCDEYNHQRGYTALIPYTRLGRPRKSESAKSFSGSFQLLHFQ